MEQNKFKQLFKEYAEKHKKPNVGSGFSISNKKTSEAAFSNEIFERIKNEIVALVFLASVDGHYMDSQKQMIASYVKSRMPGISNNDMEILSYIESVRPDIDSFYGAIDDLSEQNAVIIQVFMEKFVELIFADGYVNKNERTALAELVQTFKEDGIDLKIAI